MDNPQVKVDEVDRALNDLIARLSYAQLRRLNRDLAHWLSPYVTENSVYPRIPPPGVS